MRENDKERERDTSKTKVVNSHSHRKRNSKHTSRTARQHLLDPRLQVTVVKNVLLHGLWQRKHAIDQLFQGIGALHVPVAARVVLVHQAALLARIQAIALAIRVAGSHHLDVARKGLPIHRVLAHDLAEEP